MQDHRGTTNSPQTPSKARPLLQRFLTSPLLVDSPPPSPTYKATTTARASSVQRMSYQKQLSYQSISSSSSTSSLSSTYSYPRQQYSPVQMASQQKDTTSKSEALLRSTLLRDDRSSSPQPQASSSRIPVPSTSSTSSSTNGRPGHRRRHSCAVAPQSTRFGFGVSRQGPVSGAGVDANGDEGTESGEASLYMRANLMRRRSTNTGAPSGYMSDRSTTPRPPTLNANATPHGPSSLSSAATTQNVYGGDAEVDPRADSPQTAPFTNAARRQSSHITTTSIIPTSSSRRNSPTSSSPSPTKTTHSPPVTSKTGSIISSPRIQPTPFPQTPSQKKRQSLPASYTSSPAPHTTTLPSMQQLALPAPPPTATIPESQSQLRTTQEKDLRARLERVLKADKKAAQEAARRARSQSRSPMKGQRQVMGEEAGNSLRFINGDVYLTDDDSDEEAEEDSGSNGKASSEESLENSQGFGVARERKISMNEVRDEEGSCPWKNDTSTSTSSSTSSLPAMATVVPPTYSPKIDYTAHMRSRTEFSAYTPRHQAQPLPPSSPSPYAADGLNTNKRPPSSPLVNPRTPRTQPPHLPASPHMVPSGHEMGRTTSTRRRHAATFNLPAPPSTGVSPRARSASLAPSPRHQTIPLAQAQRNLDSSMPPPEEESRKMMITPPPTPPSGRSGSRPARGAESAARNSPFVYATTRSPRVHSSRRHGNPRSGSSSTSSSSEYDEGCLDEGHIPPLSLHENNEVDIASSPDASPDPSRPSYFQDQGISHSRRPLPLMPSALFSSEEDANMPYSAPAYRPTFNARKASERLRSTEGYISFSSVEGLGCPPEYLGDDDGKKDDERGRKGWKGLVGLSWVFGGGASAAEV